MCGVSQCASSCARLCILVRVCMSEWACTLTAECGCLDGPGYYAHSDSMKWQKMSHLTSEHSHCRLVCMLKKPALLYEYTFGAITDLKRKGNNCVVILTVIALKEKANRDGSQPIPRDSNDKDSHVGWTNNRSWLGIFCYRPPTWWQWRHMQTIYSERLNSLAELYS